MADNVLQLPAVGDFWHYSSNISLNFNQAQILNKPLNRQLLVAAVMCCFSVAFFWLTTIIVKGAFQVRWLQIIL
jgi:hypothetical protein